MTARPSPAMLSVYDGQQCVGFIINRGGGWFEAFDREEKSLGHFKSAKAASDKIMGAPRQ